MFYKNSFNRLSIFIVEFGNYETFYNCYYYFCFAAPLIICGLVDLAANCIVAFYVAQFTSYLCLI